MMKRISMLMTGAAAAMLGGSLMAGDDGDGDRGRDKSSFAVRANLVGYQEVPALSTTAKGRFVAWVDTAANTITWKLSYDALEGSVTQAHVHFGQKGVNGGISFFLCTNLGNGPAGTQACPATGPAVLEGVITADLIVGPGPTATSPGQGIEPGAFDELEAAVRRGLSYANVHTTKWPGGEIRGQLH
jgi:hypothetical protein